MNGRLDGGAPRAFALTYLSIESLGVAAYWAGLWLSPEAREVFTLSGAPPAALWSLLPAEAGLVVTGLLAVAGIYRQSVWLRGVLWLHAGSCLYAALLAIGLMLAEPRLWPGAGLMLPMLVVPLSLALAATKVGEQPSVPVWRCVVHTAVQIVFFWAFFLLIVPRLLLRVEQWLGVHSPAFNDRSLTAAGIVLFAIASGAGLWSAWSMAAAGRGTPLPTSPAQRLVVSGPYRWVANPMALTGVLQCAGVGLWIGSWMVLVYALAGGLLWHTVVRPQEERELTDRFGNSFAAYRAAVRCWLPRMTPLP